MNKIVLVALGVALAVGSLSLLAPKPQPLAAFDKKLLATFAAWKFDHRKLYKSLAEEVFRIGAFAKNFEKVRALQAAGIDYQVSLNKFADLPEEEFLSMHAGFKASSKPRRAKQEVATGSFQAPKEIDWRRFGAVNPVKDQLSCNAGYAFAAVSAFESGSRISGYSLVELSEQQVVDCSGVDGNYGCQGGDIGDAYEYILRVGGLENGLYYPYKGAAQPCAHDPSRFERPRVDDWIDLPKGSCSSLLNSVAQQPVATAVAASAMQFYSGGVFSSKYCGTSINHAVTVIGYGTDATAQKDFWLVRNSWGAAWGESGYIRMDRAIQPDTGICGICLAATYPQII